jgi:hypothetical protein
MINKFIPENFVGTKEAMKLLDVTYYSLWGKIKKDCKIKPIKIGARYYYDKDEVIAKYKEHMENKFNRGRVNHGAK